jgi:hypothetical protein
VTYKGRGPLEWEAIDRDRQTVSAGDPSTLPRSDTLLMVSAMERDKLMVPSDGGRRVPRPVGKLQLFKWSLLALAALSILIAFLLAAFVIGLLLTVPLVVLGIFWLISMAWRGKVKIRGNFR